jgi:hypothetical protein
METITKIPKEIIDLYEITYRLEGDNKAMYIPVPGNKGIIGIYGAYKLYESKHIIKIECSNGTHIELIKDVKNLLITIS